MNYRRLNLEGKRYEGTLPGYVCHLIDERNAFVVGAEESNGEIVGLCVITFSDFHVDEAFIEYLFVRKEYRKKGVAAAMVNYVSTLLQQNGARCINAKVCGAPLFVKSIYMMLLKLRFVPVTFKGHVLTYNAEHIRKGGFVEKLMNAKEALPQIIEIKDRDDMRLKRLSEKASRRGLVFNRNSYDDVYTKFYVEDNEIKGYVLAKQIDRSSVLIESLYEDPGCKTDYVTPTLLAFVLNEVQKQLPQDATKVLIQVSDDVIYKAILQVIGEGVQEFNVQEYVKPIRR